MTLRYLSVCSGIEAASVAAEPFGWVPIAFSEIDKAASNLLHHRYPGVPNWGDMTRFKEWPDADVDVLCGGTPCQSFSVAGLRQGLADPRGNLMFTFGAIAERYRPRWIVWENVPGVLSSDGGRDFAAFVGLLGQLGYGFAYRTLDAQHVRTRRFRRAVPQRRRRVFVVGYLGDWRRAAAVLFDRESLSGHPPPRREAGKGVAPTISARPTGGGGLGTDFDLDGGLISSGLDGGTVARALNACPTASGRFDISVDTFVAHTLRSGGNATGGDRPPGTDVDTCDSLIPIAIQQRATSENPDNGPQGAGIRQDGAAYTLEARHHVQAVAFTTIGYGAEVGNVASTMQASFDRLSNQVYGCIPVPWAVRRLTPVECERLQGFSQVAERFEITVCAEDKSRGDASAEASCTTSPSSAFLAADGASMPPAGCADALSNTRLPDPAPPVAVHVQIDFERSEVRTSSAGRLLWSAKFVGGSESDHLPAPIADFVQCVALLTESAARRMSHGRVEQPASTTPSTHRRSGNPSVRLSGGEIAAAVADVEFATKTRHLCTTSTTSLYGASSPIYELTLRTLSCFVANAIASSIPETIQKDTSFVVILETTRGYTDVPVGNRRSADGPRYKQLGNSWATNCAEWIFERLTEVDAW